MAVHDAGLGRQDPDGLLVALRDGVADRRQGLLRDLDRQRRRRGPARHRHPRRRAAEPQPLPGGGDRVPLHPPHRLAGRRRHRQDARQLVDDRPRRRVAGPAAGGGAGRLQVVRARALRRLGRLRRGGVGGRVLPATRRPCLDDRQGRHPALPARVGDPGGDRLVAVAALPATDRRLRLARLRARRRAGDPRGEEGPRVALPRPGDRDRAGRRAHHRQADRGARQRRRDRRPQGDDRVGLVRGPAVGHRGRLQDLRRELPGGGTPGPAAGRGPRGRVGRPQRR